MPNIFDPPIAFSCFLYCNVMAQKNHVSRVVFKEVYDVKKNDCTSFSSIMISNNGELISILKNLNIKYKQKKLEVPKITEEYHCPKSLLRKR